MNRSMRVVYCVTVCVVSVIPVPLKNRMRVQAVRVNERHLSEMRNLDIGKILRR